jgi:hypothetical protein
MSEPKRQGIFSPIISPLRDRSIREALVKALRVADPLAAVFHELPIARGEGRADVVCVNGKISGFEIKSEQDSLRRLTDQCVRYDRAFDESSVVISSCHLQHIGSHIPESWGIIAAQGEPGKIVFDYVRNPRLNRHIDPEVLIKLLWKDECLRLLRNEGVRLTPSTPIRKLWNRLAELPEEVIRSEVREALKLRQAAPPLFRCDDSRTTESTASA